MAALVVPKWTLSTDACFAKWGHPYNKHSWVVWEDLKNLILGVKAGGLVETFNYKIFIQLSDMNTELIICIKNI